MTRFSFHLISPYGTQGSGSRGWERAQRGAAAALFVAVVEALYQGQQLLVARQPQRATGKVLKPLGLALGVTRAAVWTAAAVLGVAGLKQACSKAAEAGCSALQSAQLHRRLALPRLPSSIARLKAGRGGTEEQCSDAETPSAE